MNLYINTDMVLRVGGLRDTNGEVVTGATIEATVLESDETTEVTGVNWPVVLNDDGSGNYSATLQDGMDITEGSDYWVRVDIEANGADDQRWKKIKAQKRGFGD